LRGRKVRKGNLLKVTIASSTFKVAQRFLLLAKGKANVAEIVQSERLSLAKR
jgi:hypothetical protein